MNNNITMYYIPNNPNIQKGLIYTLYINNNKNLDLSSIIPKENITINKILTPQKENIHIEKQNKSTEISNKIDQILNNIIKDIEIFSTKEKENISTIINLNKEYQNRIKEN